MAKRQGQRATEEKEIQDDLDLGKEESQEESQEEIFSEKETPKKDDINLSSILKTLSEQGKTLSQQNEIIENQQKALDELNKRLSASKSSEDNSIGTIETLLNAILEKKEVQIGSNLDEAGFKTKIDKDDILDKPITFSCFGTGLGIGSYMDGAIEVLAPYGVIMFRYQGTDRNNHGDPRHYSIYTTRSRKELEFLRSSPQYGRLFSENLNTTLSAEAQEHVRHSAIFDRVNAMTNTQISQMCDSYNIPNHGKVSQLKEELISILIKKSREQSEIRATRYAEDQKKLLLIKENTLTEK